MKRTVESHASFRRKIQVISCLLVCFALLLAPSAAQAAYITFHDEFVEDNGTGFGNVLNTLSLHQQGSATTEAGSVLWDGTDDVLSGDATPQSQTVTVAQLTSEGFNASNLIVILNLNQTGSYPWLDLHSFTVRFYTSGDGSSYFDALYDISNVWNTGSTLALTPEGNGLGTGQAGHVFRITFEGTEGDDFFANDNHRIGVLVDTPIDNQANSGPDNFYIGDADVHQVVPEPGTAGLILVTVLMLLGRKRHRSPLS